MLTSGALVQIAEYVDDQVTSGDVLIGGTVYELGIRRSLVDGRTVRKHLYLSHKDPHGTIDRARLFNKQGEVFAERTDPQVHEEGKGLLLEFKFTIQEV